MAYGNFKDDQYPLVKDSFVNRLIARAIIIDDNKVFFEKIYRDDMFGQASYIETPGGGVNEGEDLISCVRREVEEECGLKIEVIKYLGLVEDDYNLLLRHNISHYFLCKIIGKGNFRREAYENDFIKDMTFIPLDEVKRILANPENKISKIIYRREKVIIDSLEEEKWK